VQQSESWMIWILCYPFNFWHCVDSVVWILHVFQRNRRLSARTLCTCGIEYPNSWAGTKNLIVTLQHRTENTITSPESNILHAGSLAGVLQHINRLKILFLI